MRKASLATVAILGDTALLLLAALVAFAAGVLASDFADPGQVFGLGPVTVNNQGAAVNRTLKKSAAIAVAVATAFLGVGAMAQETVLVAPAPAILPTGCSLTGAAIGGLLLNSLIVGRGNTAATVAGIVGGAIAGHNLCVDHPEIDQALAPVVGGYGESSQIGADGRLYVYRTYAGAMLPPGEQQRLDYLEITALDAKIAWKHDLYRGHRAYERERRQPYASEMDQESYDRNAFAAARFQFAAAVIDFSSTTAPDGQIWQLGEYKEVASALLTFQLDRPVSYRDVCEIDGRLKQQAHVYERAVDGRPSPYRDSHAMVFDAGEPAFPLVR